MQTLKIIFLIWSCFLLSLIDGRPERVICELFGSTCLFKNKLIGKNQDIIVIADHFNTTDEDIISVRFEDSSVYSIPPELFETFENLENLYMVNQSVTEIRLGTFENAAKLKYLDLKTNKLTLLYASNFRGADQLEKLLLTGNKISKVHENAFENLEVLKELTLNSNEISELPEDVFKSTTSLETLELSTNQLDILRKNLFQNNEKLKTLRIISSRVSAMSGKMFSHLKNLNQLDLERNFCVNKDFKSGANQKFDVIESELRNCTISFVSQENFELSKTLGEMNVSFDYFKRQVEDRLAVLETEVEKNEKIMIENVEKLESEIEEIWKLLT